MRDIRTIFEKSQEGQHAYSLPKSDEAFTSFTPPQHLCRQEPLPLPEVTELDMTRHYSLLSHRNCGIDTTFYPLGSCTMKFNPRINETCAALPGFARVHPFAAENMAQGCLHILHQLVEKLCVVSGMYAGTLTPNAGAQGEFAALKMVQAYHHARGDFHRNEVIVPEDAHGTNPATVRMAGYKVIPVRNTPDGSICLEHLKESVSERTVGLMLTNPSTLGLFHANILEVSAMIHEVGGLLYYDGANLNAILNICCPGEMGFDVMHINLHKTFSTPHGGGGPGAGPVLCSERLAPFLPKPYITFDGKQYGAVSPEQSIGRISSFFGNFAICLRAYVYIMMHGMTGLRKLSEAAIISANYLKSQLANLFTVPFSAPCMHEFVIQVEHEGVRALDIAKRLLDYGIHAPTVYFPLIVKECMLIEPTETESKATLDNFVSVMRAIIQEIESDIDVVKEAPHTTFCRRLDEAQAARNPVVSAV